MSFDLGRWLPEFPIRERCLYLDHAAVCPLPFPVAEAMRRRITGQEQTGYEGFEEWRHATLACRHLGGQIMGCGAEDISIVTSTSTGLSFVAEGLDWREGDEVLVGDEEFAANVAPWLNLRDRGVEVVRYPQPDGRVDPTEVELAMTGRTRLLAVSWVAFHSGWIAPLAQLGELCRERGVILVVDAIQGLGVLPMDLGALRADAVVADGHKWLLGPEGAGLMATTPELRGRLRPAVSGWRNIERERGSFFLHHLEHRTDGRRFEPGAGNEVGIAGLAAALDLLTSVGFETVQARVEMLARLLTRTLLAHGWDVFSPGSGQPIAGIVSARPSGIAPTEAARRLRERKVVCSVRQGSVRFSPHFYTTKGELEALDRILEKVGL
ncbi:MAG TPA: aminotransferase class V-fold PLP-dependent enzyme [Candidatus Sulfomarinibacteraceae bacterium]|nr:aminotransferase class V-fold PLP-dependent enzyme [Candidatus Sulfomarinibacteraceae bacterium]